MVVSRETQTQRATQNGKATAGPCRQVQEPNEGSGVTLMVYNLNVDFFWGTTLKYNHLLQSMLYSAVMIVPAAGANAASVSMSDSATSYSCATFSTIAFDAAGNATVTCNGTVTGGAPTPTLTPTTPTTTTTTPPTTTTTTTTTTTDPGYGTGLWLPPNTTNLFVVDQVNRGGLGAEDYIPGCINFTKADFSSDTCALHSTFTSGTTKIAMAQGNILSMRFPSKDVLSQEGGSFLLKAADGRVTRHAFSMWLTLDPTTSYEATDPSCKNMMWGTKTQTVTSGKYGCSIRPGTLYYLNIRIDDACSDADCRFYLTEDSNDFNY